MRILNLYANIGGNRKLWGDEHEITAVELNPKIASLYQELWPKDIVVVGDAHQYLLDHFHEFDFIWSSPPCPTHSKMNIMNGVDPYAPNQKQIDNGGGIAPRYVDMTLYQEIILLKTWFRGKWCIENVKSYYEPLVMPVLFGSHYFWTNFFFPVGDNQKTYRGIAGKTQISLKEFASMKGFDLKDLEGKGINIRLALKDVTEPELGKLIFDWAQKEDNLALF